MANKITCNNCFQLATWAIRFKSGECLVSCISCIEQFKKTFDGELHSIVPLDSDMVTANDITKR
jgi:hypothetical protein